MSIDLDEIRSRGKITRDGFYHVVGAYYVVREADFDALVAEVEHLRAALTTMQGAYELGSDTERAAVVAWLRDRNERCREWDRHELAVSATYRLAAAIIERGEHRKGDE